jgi:hypothetical protein
MLKERTRSGRVAGDVAMLAKRSGMVLIPSLVVRAE